MRKRLTFGAVVLAALMAAAQAGAVGLTFRDGTSFSFELVRSIGSSSRTELGSGVVTGDGVGYRILFDTKGGRFFGYTVKGTRLPEDRFRLELGPLSPETLDRLARDFEEGHGSKLAGESLAIDYPPALEVKNDEPVMLELMKNPSTGETLSDVIRVKATKPIEPDRLRVAQARVTINGKPMTDSGSVSARYIWFSLPGKGRFVFSTEAVDGYDFAPAELVDNLVIRFSADGDTYEWTSVLPVIQTAPFLKNLWVWHDSDFPVPKRSSFGVGAMDALPSR